MSLLSSSYGESNTEPVKHVVLPLLPGALELDRSIRRQRQFEGCAAEPEFLVAPLDRDRRDAVRGRDAVERAGEWLFGRVVGRQETKPVLGAVGAEDPPPIGVAVGGVVWRRDRDGEASPGT